MDMRKNIRSLEDLKPMTITLLKQSHLEKISLPNLKVSTFRLSDRPQQQQVCSLAVCHQVGHDEFAQLEKIFEGESQPTFEYFADSQEVVVLSPPSPIHQHYSRPWNVGLKTWERNCVIAGNLITPRTGVVRHSFFPFPLETKKAHI